MGISHRISRRLLTGIGLAAAAIALPTAALAASGGATSATRVASLPMCTSAHTEAWLGIPGDAGMSQVHYQLEISNVGTSACTLYGYPGVSALNSHGKMVGVPATHGGTKVLVILQPGGTAHVVLDIIQPGVLGGCGAILNATVLRVYAPGEYGALYVPFSVQVCSKKANMSVDAVHPGAGIPFYSYP